MTNQVNHWSKVAILTVLILGAPLITSKIAHACKTAYGGVPSCDGLSEGICKISVKVLRTEGYNCNIFGGNCDDSRVIYHDCIWENNKCKEAGDECRSVKRS